MTDSDVHASRISSAARGRRLPGPGTGRVGSA